MKYKDGLVSAQVMSTILRVAAALYVLFPVYAAALFFYRPPRINWIVVSAELVLFASLSLTAAIDLHRARHGQWDRFTSWFSFLQVCLGLALASLVNATAGGTPEVYRIMLIIPAITAAVLGDEMMIFVIWFMTVVALGILTYRATHEFDTTSWNIAVWGSALAGILVSIHILVDRFLQAMRVSDALRRLASSGSEDPRWPDDLQRFLPDIAQALQADWITTLGCSIGREPQLIAAWPIDEATIPMSSSVAEALESDRPIQRGKTLLIPVATTVEPKIVLVAPRHDESADAIFGADHGVAQTVASLVAGMADRAALLENLQQQVRSDALTGLANRRALDEALYMELNRHRRSEQALSVAMIDLDHFKDFNDKYGHPAGDDLLREMARRMKTRSRRNDVVARYGGEEFCLVLPGTPARGALAVLDGVRSDGPVRVRVTIPINQSDTSPSSGVDASMAGVTFSAGVTQWNGQESAAELIARADRALYEAKGTGRDCIVVVDAPDPTGSIRTHLQDRGADENLDSTPQTDK